LLQRSIGKIEIIHKGFEWVLAHSCLGSFKEQFYKGYKYRDRKKRKELSCGAVRSEVKY